MNDSGSNRQQLRTSAAIHGGAADLASVSIESARQYHLYMAKMLHVYRESADSIIFSRQQQYWSTPYTPTALPNSDTHLDGRKALPWQRACSFERMHEDPNVRVALLLVFVAVCARDDFVVCL